MPQPPAKVGGTPPALTDALTSAAGYAAEEKAAATRRAYRSDWADFGSWCLSRQAVDLPAAPETVAAYLAHLADTGSKASTISRRVAAIAYAHRLKGQDPPMSSEPVRAVLRGIRRRIGVAPVRKAPATAAAIAAMLERVPESITGIRDRAILLIGFAAALRRSELVSLKVQDIEAHPDGVLLHISRSKTDQEGEGAVIPIPRGGRLQPVEALENWLRAHEGNQTRNSGSDVNRPLFVSIAKGGRISNQALSDRAVADIVKRYAAAAGFDPKQFAGHSLRAGFVTSALEDGADPFKVMDITRHRRIDTLKIYDRRAKAFKNHAGKGFL